MTVTINGTTGVAGVDGTATTPAIQGNDTNTGIFFPAADTIAFAEGGAEVARFDSNGNLGVGTSSPTTRLHIVGATTATSQLTTQHTGSAVTTIFGCDGGIDAGAVYVTTNHPLAFRTNNTERMRIDSSGNVIFGATALTSPTLYFTDTADGGFFVKNANTTSATTAFDFLINGTRVGSITTSGSNTTYSTSSDYRLKENVSPMVGSLTKVTQLKPCTYTWKVDGSAGQGFIAHELAEVFPDAVVGEKDAVNEDGSIKPQGIDTSFLVATLTAALQELNAKVDSLQAELATLKGQA